MRKILTIITAIFLFSACEKFLEVDPKNVLTMQTFEDAKNLMGGYLYYYVEGEKVNNTYDILVTSMDDSYFVLNYYADDLNTDIYLDGSWQARNNRGLFLQSLDWYEGDLHSRLWRENYSNIGFFNTIISNVLEYASNVSQDEANRVLGEAKFLRAYSLFKLLQYFAPYANNELGIPVNLDPDAVSSYDSKRWTQTQVYDLIISELKEILDFTTVPSVSYNIFYDKQIINALLAKVYHFKGESGASAADDYENAILYAKEAIKNKQITPMAEMDDLFVFDDYGIVKGLDYALLAYRPFYFSNGGINNIVGYPPYNLKEYVRDELYDLFLENPDDVRLEHYLLDGTNQINKFSNLGSSQNKHYFFRVAELQLIIAESYARLGDDSNAILYLEGLQSNRIANYTGYSGTDVLGEILKERRRELCFEYDIRWTDLVRFQTSWSRLALDLDQDTEDTHTIEQGDYRFTMPIPLDEELKYNNQIDQNPGWDII